jgi:hypothetical protein
LVRTPIWAASGHDEELRLQFSRTEEESIGSCGKPADKSAEIMRECTQCASGWQWAPKPANPTGTRLKTLFGTRVLVGIGGDNLHQIPNHHSLLKVYLVLEYWASIIPANPHSFLNFSVFFSIFNTLSLPSGLWVEFYGD